MYKKGKPVRKCHGCILNVGNRCAAYEDPHDKWHNSKCTSYNDQVLFQKYKEDIEKHPENEAKKQRKELARKHNSEEHHQGQKGNR